MRVGSLALAVVLAVSVAHAEPPTQELITKLSDPSPEVRQQAARQLGYRAKEAARFDPLEKAATSDSDPTVRLRALEGLSPQYLDIGKAARWKSLRMKLLKDADPQVRYEAVRQLRPAEPDTYAAHFAVLESDKDPKVKTLTILSLHDTRAPGLVDAIAPMIDDLALQSTVISTLGYSKDPRAVPILIDAVKRELPYSAGALANTNDPRAIEPILAALQHTTNVERRFDAIRAIIELPDGRAVPRLVELWTKLSKADKKLSVRPQQDVHDDMNDLPHSLTDALRAIAEVDQAPCLTAKAATGEAKAYLKKILPAKCGGVDATAAIEKLVEAKLAAGGKPDSIYLADAVFSIAGAADEPQVSRDRIAAIVAGASVTSRSVGLSADGKSAWIAIVVKRSGVEWRVSELAVQTAGGWRIAGGIASSGQDNKAVNAAAKTNKLTLAALPQAKPDASLVGAFTALTTGPFDAAATARTELVAFGSGPGERTTSGPVLARAWKAAWAKRITVDGPVITRLAPSGTTGYALANISLEKPGTPAYKIPFRLLFVFDKTGSSWSLVHAHFATAKP